MANTTTDQTCTWAYGIAAPGWYCARTGWNEAYSKHLESLGYRVIRSALKPTEQ
jgi:hypothetical protein